MIVPLLLFLSSLGVLGLALLVPAYGDLVLVAGPSALASLWLLLRAHGRGRRADPAALPRQHPHFAKPAGAAPWVVVDGSNVMYWRDGTPQAATLRTVLEGIVAAGLTPGVVFDANAGHLLEGRYLHHDGLGALIGLPEAQVLVVPKGTVADRIVLETARALGARIVTNDRYRDWADPFPEVAEPGHLIRGSLRDGRLWLNLPALTAPTSVAAG